MPLPFGRRKRKHFRLRQRGAVGAEVRDYAGEPVETLRKTDCTMVMAYVRIAAFADDAVEQCRYGRRTAVKSDCSPSCDVGRTVGELNAGRLIMDNNGARAT